MGHKSSFPRKQKAGWGPGSGLVRRGMERCCPNSERDVLALVRFAGPLIQAAVQIRRRAVVGRRGCPPGPEALEKDHRSRGTGCDRRTVAGATGPPDSRATNRNWI